MIEQIFTYDTNGNPQPQCSVLASLAGLAGNRSHHPWKQLLILPRSTLTDFNLKPAELKENILINAEIDIHALPSGTVIGMGPVEIRLTIHCEPCHKIKHLVSPAKMLHQRGYLGQIITGGTLSVGDSLSVLGQRFESIPYAIAERIRWRVDQLQEPILAARLMEDIGLSKSYCRILPGLLKRHPDIDREKILFASKRHS